MGRKYAAMMGYLAFAITIARGLIHASGIQATMELAIAWLIAAAVAGWVMGELAARIVEESIVNGLKTDGAGTSPSQAAS